VDVIFRRFDRPTLIVAGETDKTIASVKTKLDSGKLVIERTGVVLFSSGNQHQKIIVSGHGNNIAGGNVCIGNQVIIAGKQISSGVSHGKVVVAIGLPAAPAIKIEGSGDVTLLDLQQAGLSLKIQGSGEIAVFGQVANLDVQIDGSGEVDASELVADRASLAIAGSGDIEVFVRSEVKARVAGSGDILVRGNPQFRDHSVAGSGKIKFR